MSDVRNGNEVKEWVNEFNQVYTWWKNNDVNDLKKLELL